MYIHPHSVIDKVFEVWRSPGRFTKNPDLIALPDGRLMLVYSDTDAHWSQKNQILTLLASDDGGKTWYKHCEIDEAHLEAGEERLVTPRLSILKDGRLVVIVDHNDDGHFHEDQPKGNWLYWSSDNGDTWIRQTENGIGGFEPDRVMDLPDGTLGVASQHMRGDGQEMAEVLWVSSDSGNTWTERATIAYNGYHRFVEGAIVLLDGGKRLACVMRENHSAGIPCFVAFSEDNGHTWSDPQMLPFAIHRPYVKELNNGRVLVTGRHVSGGLGTYAWVGDLETVADTYFIGGPRCQYDAELTPDAFVIHNHPEHECRYTLLPPESSFSEVSFEAEVRVEASGSAGVAFMSISRLGQILTIAPDYIGISRGRHEMRYRLDMTTFHKLRLYHQRGWLQVQVDGETVLNRSIFREETPAQDFRGDDPLKRTQFGQLGSAGSSYWKQVNYTLRNPNLPDFHWSWQVESQQWPDQAQRDQLIQIHANHPAQQPWPDHGYSSWLQLDDGAVFLVDYTNQGDVPDTSHLVGVYIQPEDLNSSV